jgi:hypothetical protein
MKRFVSFLAMSILIVTLGSGLSYAQSSGSFNYSADTLSCTDIGGTLGGGTPKTALTTTMKVSSGNGVALVIRPSAVVGLLTNLSLSGKAGAGTVSAAAQSGVQFQVTVTSLSGQGPATVTPSAAVTFDDRFIQISTNLFSLLTTCTSLTPATTCFFDFNETTLSAHSFDWVVTNMSSGDYGITVTWTPYTNFTAPNNALACVGPVVLTAEQTKIFDQNTGISF